jgi:hypothetical protein
MGFQYNVFNGDKIENDANNDVSIFFNVSTFGFSRDDHASQGTRYGQYQKDIMNFLSNDSSIEIIHMTNENIYGMSLDGN